MSDTITLTINRENDVIDLLDFASMFAGIGSQFDKFLKAQYPEVHGHAQIGIRDLHYGCIIAELAGVILPNTIAAMDSAVIMHDFARLIKAHFEKLLDGNFLPGARKSDLNDLSGMVSAIAKDADANASLEFEERDVHGNIRRKVNLKFTTKQARAVEDTIERQRRSMDQTEGADYERVLMYFTRADTGDARIDQRSGERVVIRELSTRELPLIYAAALAEQRIKSEIREATSVFQKGFVVDVNLRRRVSGQLIAYAVVNVRSVIDLPEEEEDEDDNTS